jgi:hypothetical protein
MGKVSAGRKGANESREIGGFESTAFALFGEANISVFNIFKDNALTGNDTDARAVVTRKNFMRGSRD